MDSVFIKSLIVGALVMLALYLSLSKVFDINNYSVRKALGLFAGAAGLLTTFWFLENPALLEKYVAEIVIGGIGIVLALLSLAKKQ
ncbi:MAG: hypothetical protein HN390_01075 [Anaerolineae bacterium]|jgi:hypothetical protein|nr:hypothetical protein [Anaerolineae bacterium]MBT7189154.1 hypothetical protein [Anaerolineae bacterium]MBT7988653.1 hypothetical protein [Anaerolineae bacterium]